MNKIIAVLLALAIAMLASSVHAEWQWKHFGAAPYAVSKEDAMKTRESAFLKLGFSTEVTALLMEATKKPGEKITLKAGDRFSAQISKGGVVHGLNEGGGIVAFESPVRGMEYVAPAEKWQITFEGKTYTVFLPEVCFNWTSIIGQATPPTVSLLTVTSKCPNGWNVHINEWFWSSLSADLRTEVERLIKAAEARNSRNATSLAAYTADDVSGKLGGRFRREVGTRAQINEEVTVNLRDPKTGGLLENLGSFKVVAGEGDVKLTEAQYAMIVEVIFPGDYVKSPTVSGGQRRLWSRPDERQDTCGTNVHKVDRR